MKGSEWVDTLNISLYLLQIHKMHHNTISIILQLIGHYN